MREHLDFSYLDSPDLREKYATGADHNSLSLYVEGMSCTNCVRKIESLPLKVPGLLSMRVELNKKIAHAEIDPSQTSFSEVTRAIQTLGYDPIPLTAESKSDELERKSDRRELIRLAVGGACAGNIMSFAFANYFGAASSEWAPLFGWISFALYLPVLTFVAWPFYRGAWAALKNRTLSIDLPMTVASLAGFAFSTVELIRGRDDIYFDSLSSFLFLILLSRWVQRRMQKRFLQPGDILDSLQLMRVRLETRNNWKWIPQELLKADDTILVKASETVPADAELVTPQGYFSLAFLSGEAAPKTFLRGATIPAGARLLAGEARLVVRKTLNETSFGQLLKQTQEYSLKQNRTVQISDRWAQWLLGTVTAIALSFLVLYWHVSPEEAVRRSLALIILACPCAMAFGTPLAIAAAIRKARRLGVIVRDGGTFEQTKDIDTIFFDKTGTLTDTELSLVEDPLRIPEPVQNVVLALENHSIHPMAFAFRKAFSGRHSLLEVHGYREVPGVGVEGYVAGVFYQLQKPTSCFGETGCVLRSNNREMHSFHFKTSAKPDAVATIASLREHGLTLRLISGDSSLAAQKLGQELGFQPWEILGNLTPADKARIVSESPRSIMVGDGVNDAPALMQAKIGIAVSGGVEAAFKSASVILTEPKVEGVLSFLKAGQSSFRMIRRNLIFSAAYNTTAGVLALLGFVNPYVAAVLMPASSGLILFATWLGSRE